MSNAQTPPPAGSAAKPRLAALALGALGVIYGDIGTSPLYAVRECFHGPHAVDVSQANVLGVLSLIFWALTFVVCVQYLMFVLRADNRGEGGVFALLALVPTGEGERGARLKALVVLVALAGAALIFGDGVITPAISVLSAVEGLGVATEAANDWIVPLSCAILAGLFWAQSRGTARIGRVFGPVMLLWFSSIAALGVRWVMREPAILAAANPAHAFRFFLEHRLHASFVLGSVVLVITGVEALYADLGHFNKKPIRLAWFGLVFPALLANYLGQGALLLADPSKAANPFYGLVPRPDGSPNALLYPVVALATAATVIASQAMISGAFSLTRQAVQLGFLPRLHMVHTSSAVEGQIYIPAVNITLMLGCLALVVAIRESSGLAGAYGIAVTAAMTITSILYYLVARRRWRWSLRKALPLLALFLLFNLAFLSATLLKLPYGGWISLAIAGLVFLVMTTWRDGRAQLAKRMYGRKLPLDLFLDDVAKQKPHRVEGTAVFMTSQPDATPVALLHHLKLNRTLHEKVLLLSILTADVPVVAPAEQSTLDELPEGFYRLLARYGFMQTPNVPELLRQAGRLGLAVQPATATFFLSRESLLLTGKSGMARWRKAIFAFFSRNAVSPTAYFDLPPGRVIELGLQIEL
ncbi:MAG: potassium transporter Kup [Planctomycetes bacterium]|nr:potassium transporter Kup [Planctomycetota bacterium]